MPKEALSSLTEPMYYVLLSLSEPLCGIEIMDRVKELSRGRLTIGPGTLYTMLAKFEENGLIVPVTGPLTDSGKRKRYAITRLGADMLRAEYRRLLQCIEDGKEIIEWAGS